MIEQDHEIMRDAFAEFAEGSCILKFQLEHFALLRWGRQEDLDQVTVPVKLRGLTVELDARDLQIPPEKEEHAIQGPRDGSHPQTGDCLQCRHMRRDLALNIHVHKVQFAIRMVCGFRLLDPLAAVLRIATHVDGGALAETCNLSTSLTKPCWQSEPTVRRPSRGCRGSRR